MSPYLKSPAAHTVQIPPRTDQHITVLHVHAIGNDMPLTVTPGPEGATFATVGSAPTHIEFSPDETEVEVGRQHFLTVDAFPAKRLPRRVTPSASLSVGPNVGTEVKDVKHVVLEKGIKGRVVVHLGERENLDATDLGPDADLFVFAKLPELGSPRISVKSGEWVEVSEMSTRLRYKGEVPNSVLITMDPEYGLMAAMAHYPDKTTLPVQVPIAALETVFATPALPQLEALTLAL